MGTNPAHYKRKERCKMFRTQMAIEVKTQFEGLHSWPEAPAEVAYLRNMHRHIFHIVVRIPVNHDDRDLEFIMVKHALDEYIKSSYDVCADSVARLGRRSCEAVARDIAKWVQTKYGRDSIVGVSEDGENGCWIDSNTSLPSNRGSVEG